MFTKKLTVYPTYGFKQEADQNTWIIPMRAWLRNKQPLPPGALIRLCVDEEGNFNEQEILRLKHCLEDFLAIDNDNEKVSFKFHHDPDNETFQLNSRTDDNGLIDEEFRLSEEKVQRLLAAQQAAGEGTGWLTLTARTKGLSGKAESSTRIRLTEPEGLTVVSDIDDTIKVTDIPAGKATVLKRTFLMEYEDSKGMRDRYLKTLERHPDFHNVAFHYVSGSPWQMFTLLQEFLIEQVGFPPGVFHMKKVNFSYEHFNDSLRDLRRMLDGSKDTQQQKEDEISKLMTRFPKRKFILIGDTGERDPEVFREMKNRFGDQVLKIYIRDVNKLGEGAERLGGMRRIDTDGVCLLDEADQC